MLRLMQKRINLLQLPILQLKIVVSTVAREKLSTYKLL